MTIARLITLELTTMNTACRCCEAFRITIHVAFSSSKSILDRNAVEPVGAQATYPCAIPAVPLRSVHTRSSQKVTSLLSSRYSLSYSDLLLSMTKRLLISMTRPPFPSLLARPTMSVIGFKVLLKGTAQSWVSHTVPFLAGL